MSYKFRLGYDDSLDAFGVHGIGGIIGALLTGVFATHAINSNVVNEGLFYSGNFHQLGIQALSVLVSVVFCGAGSFLLLSIIKLFVPLRLSKADEAEGLDLVEHGENGYNLGDISLGHGFPTPLTHGHAANAPQVPSLTKSPAEG